MLHEADELNAGRDFPLFNIWSFRASVDEKNSRSQRELIVTVRESRRKDETEFGLSNGVVEKKDEEAEKWLEGAPHRLACSGDNADDETEREIIK